MSRKRDEPWGSAGYKELGQALYRPVQDASELAELERRVKRAASEFLVHGMTWVGVSGLFVIINLVTTFFQTEQDLAGRVWSIFPVLGWGIGVAAHGVQALVAQPRALAAQRHLLALREGTPTPSADAERPEGAIAAPAATKDLREAVERVRRNIAALQPPRLDLEASLEVAEREGLHIESELARLQSAAGAAREADPRRRESLQLEQERLRTGLERLHVTLANLEVDALLMQSAPRTQGFASEQLEAEASLLRAAVEGLQKARETLAAEAPRGGARQSRRA